MAYKYNPIAGQLDLVTDLTFTSITAGLGYTPVNVAGDTMLGSLILDADPTTALGAATKQYVDNLAIGLNFHSPVVAATTAPLPSVTYSNGIAGVGATLIATAPGALTIDTVSFTGGERVLIKDQVSGLENGIYVVNVPGDGLTPFELERATDADNSPSGELVYGDFCFVQQGLNNGGLGYILNTVGTITVGTTPISYVVFNAAQVVTAGYGLLELTPNVLSVDTSVILDVATAALTYYPLSSNPAGYLTSGSVFGTTGSVLFAGASGILSQDNTNFFWDDANNRLGIGTNTPTATLDVNGEIYSQGYRIRQIAGGSYFNPSGALGYIFNNSADSSNLVYIKDTGELVINNANVIQNGTLRFSVQSPGTDPTLKKFVAEFVRKTTNNTGLIISTKEGTAYLQSFTSNSSNADFVIGGYSAISGFLDTITLTSSGNIEISDTTNVVLSTGTGTKIGTSTTQKLGFFNATPIVQPGPVTDAQGIADALTNLGLLVSSTISGGGGPSASAALFNYYNFI
jgi:hypothetical protein